MVLHFGAAESVLYAYVNGRAVGLSKGSRLPAEFDVTEARAPGRERPRGDRRALVGRELRRGPGPLVARRPPPRRLPLPRPTRRTSPTCSSARGLADDLRRAPSPRASRSASPARRSRAGASRSAWRPSRAARSGARRSRRRSRSTCAEPARGDPLGAPLRGLDRRVRRAARPRAALVERAPGPLPVLVELRDPAGRVREVASAAHRLPARRDRERRAARERAPRADPRHEPPRARRAHRARRVTARVDAPRHLPA